MNRKVVRSDVLVMLAVRVPVLVMLFAVTFLVVPTPRWGWEGQKSLLSKTRFRVVPYLNVPCRLSYFILLLPNGAIPSPVKVL